MVKKLLDGDVRALARSITLVEENAPGAVEVLRQVFPRTGGSTVIGITGSPGAGKSSLVDGLVAAYRAKGSKVGVVAVDPSSAYSGGAILGDRIRMQQHAIDSGVFIRSMATRGYLGGLSRAAGDAIDLMDAAGYDPILVETVGVGQDEIEVVGTADVVCVVLVPGMGDDIQAIKAGILEIADLFIVNKADKPGVERLVMDLQYMISLAPGRQENGPPILKTIAARSEGIEEMLDSIGEYVRGAGRDKREERRRERAARRLRTIVSERLTRMLMDRESEREHLDRLIDRVAHRQIDPYSAAEQLLAKVEVGT